MRKLSQIAELASVMTDGQNRGRFAPLGLFGQFQRRPRSWQAVVGRKEDSLRNFT